jgi:hypothetical protein
MITYMTITVLTFALVGLAFLNEAIKTAAVGFEDDFGFHEGNEPQVAFDFATEMHAAVASPIALVPKVGVRRKRIQKSFTPESVDHGTAIPFPN